MSTDVIFISSTNIDLAEYRQIARNVCQELNISVVAQEYEHPDGTSAAAEFSEGLGDKATCYLGIVAWRYGFVPSGRDRSVTELEYERAQNHPRGPIPRFMFLLREGTPWNPTLMDLDRTEVMRFRNRVSKELVCEFFADLNEFKLQVKTALLKRVLERFGREVRNSDQFRKAIYETHSKLALSYRDIQRIARFKAMHDCLHAIRQDCVNVFYEQVLEPLSATSGADTAPSKIPEDYQEIVERAVGTFRAHKDKLATLSAQRPKLPFVDDCLRSFEEVDAKCVIYSEQQSIRLLQNVASDIERFLTQPFTQLNERMSESVGELDLDLPPVIEALEQALVRAVKQLNEVAADALGRGIAVIRGEQERLRLDIRKHDAWQELHDLFVPVDPASGMPEDYAAAIRRVWGECKNRCFKLASPREQEGSRGAEELLRRMTAVSVAIDAQKPRGELVEKFQQFRRAFDDEFYDVDMELNNHCNQLATEARKVLEAVLGPQDL